MLLLLLLLLLLHVAAVASIAVRVCLPFPCCGPGGQVPRGETATEISTAAVATASDVAAAAQ